MSTEMSNIKRVILDTVSDLTVDFLYYDRREDEDLHVGQIEEAIINGEITIEEILEEFRKQLTANLENE